MAEPAAAARDRPPDPAGRPASMSIGEVLAQLRADFPDTTISKLRFLEAEGLVEPRRTAAGYRKYSWDDVARLRYVLTAQRDHYLPLRVIRERLVALERGEPPGGRPGVAGSSGRAGPVADSGPGWPRPALVAVGSTADADPATDPADLRLRRDDLLERAGISAALLDGMQQYGLVAPRPGGWYDADALAIAEVVGQLAGYGLEPRHLRGYRGCADREVSLFTQLVAPLARQADPVARGRAAEAVRELTLLSQRLHALLVRVGLRDTLGR